MLLRYFKEYQFFYRINNLKFLNEKIIIAICTDICCENLNNDFDIYSVLLVNRMRDITTFSDLDTKN